MRRGRRWISSQCYYTLGRATDRRRYRSVRLRTPRHHDSDHRAIITNIRAGSATSMAAYRKRMAKFPLKLPSGPQDELCAMFEGLRLDVVAPPKRAQPRNSWISAPTWGLIDRRASLRQQGKLTKRDARLLGRQIALSLKGDRRQRAADVAETIEGHLAGRETKEAWRCLKGWYKTTSESAPAASPMSLAAQTAERGADIHRRERNEDPRQRKQPHQRDRVRGRGERQAGAHRGDDCSGSDHRAGEVDAAAQFGLHMAEQRRTGHRVGGDTVQADAHRLRVVQILAGSHSRFHRTFKGHFQFEKPPRRLAVNGQRSAVNAADQIQLFKQRGDALPFLQGLSAQVLWWCWNFNPWVDSIHLDRSPSGVAAREFQDIRFWLWSA